MKKLFVLIGLILGMALYAQPGSPDANGAITPGSPWVTGIPSGGGEMELQLDYIYNQVLENKDSITAYATDFTTGELNVTGKIEQNTNFVFTPDDHTFVDAFNTPWQYSNISVSMYPSSTSKNPVLFLKQDTITVVPGVYKTSNYSKRQVFWKGGGSQHFIGGFSNQTNITNKFDALNLFGAQNINVLKLQSADTVSPVVHKGLTGRQWSDNTRLPVGDGYSFRWG